jgi:hypothetical protein
VVGVISDHLSSRKMKKEARTLTGEQDRMFASAASAKRSELAGRDASLALVFQPQEIRS